MSRTPGDGHGLRAALETSHAQAAEISRTRFPRAEFETLQTFQVQRLERSYADLAAQERYRAAVEFFLEELYGGLHFRERDQQVEQVLPVMQRLLPEHMLLALSDALHLQGLSIGLDIRLSQLMRTRGLTRLDDRSYGSIYRTVAKQERKEQLGLIRDLGMELCEVVRHRFVLLLIRAMRGPAHAAGFGALQGFLERGLTAFRAMGDGGPAFVEIIHARETAVMQRLYSGESDPFRP